MHELRRNGIHVTDFGRVGKKKAPAVTPPGLRRFDVTAGVTQPDDKATRIVAVAQYRAMGKLGKTEGPFDLRQGDLR